MVSLQESWEEGHAGHLARKQKMWEAFLLCNGMVTASNPGPENEPCGMTLHVGNLDSGRANGGTMYDSGM